ncbi:MAG TPA: hypothetical protein VFS51_07415, partial [Gemmatimonadales bacterium]|nr:hypothetical protein [Gemmatimonadales bacterium]
ARERLGHACPGILVGANAGDEYAGVRKGWMLCGVLARTPIRATVREYGPVRRVSTSHHRRLEVLLSFSSRGVA